MSLRVEWVELLKIAELAVEHSDGRLLLVYNEEDESDEFVASAARFLKLDGKRLGRDIKLYGFLGDEIVGWPRTIVMFLGEVVRPLKNNLPGSYAQAAPSLCVLGEQVYTDESLLERWRDLF